MTTLADIEALADGATPGPWTDETIDGALNGSVVGPDGDEVASTYANLGISERVITERDNAAYIAALSPEVVKALVAVARASDGYGVLIREVVAQATAGINEMLASGDIDLSPEMRAQLESGREEGHPGQVMLDALDALHEVLA